MKTVAFVPIRLNSKRVVGKNLKMLGNKPLLCYILDTLVNVKRIDEVYVYCSSEEIIKYLPQGVKFLKRPESLDRDETLGKEIYEEFEKNFLFEVPKYQRYYSWEEEQIDDYIKDIDNSDTIEAYFSFCFSASEI